MHERKYKKYRMSKHKYPTRIVMNGNTGSLQLGEEVAARAFKSKYGFSVDGLIPLHTRFEWVWGKKI